MENLTPRQEEYLLLFAARDGCGNGISEAAQRFGVSKATVSVVCTALTKYGMIRKSEQGEITLTQQGWDYIEEKLDTTREVATSLMTRLGLAPYQAETEARRIVVNLQPETVAAMLGSWNSGTPAARAGSGGSRKSAESRRSGPDLPKGEYEIPFRVCKAGKNDLSMGDRGFLKPARLVCTEDTCAFYLRSAHFSYKPMHHKLMAGRLERLWCQVDGAWLESPLSPEGTYRVPGQAMCRRDTENGPIGTVRIRARATVGIRKMPESEADLVFFLGDIQGKK